MLDVNKVMSHLRILKNISIEKTIREGRKMKMMATDSQCCTAFRPSLNVVALEPLLCVQAFVLSLVYRLEMLLCISSGN